MKKLLLCLVLSSGFVHAEALDLTIKNFNFSYTDPHGEGSATSFYRSPAFQEAVQVSVDKVDQVFKLQVSGAETHELEFKDAPPFILNAQTMSIANLNLDTVSNLQLSLQSGQFYSTESALKLEGLSLVCDRERAQVGMDQFYHGCIRSLTLKTKKFSSEAVEEALTNALSESVTVNSVDLKVSGGKYTLSSEVKAGVSGKVKSTGNISYDSSKGLITLKISEVKFSILNITGKVFDELRKKESEKLKVKEPYVYITVK